MGANTRTILACSASKEAKALTDRNTALQQEPTDLIDHGGTLTRPEGLAGLIGRQNREIVELLHVAHLGRDDSEDAVA